MKRLGCVVALSLLFAGAAAAEIFKCPDATGKIAYQDSPCDGSMRGWTENGEAAKPAERPKTITKSVPVGTPLQGRPMTTRPMAPRPAALPPVDSVARASEYEMVLALSTYRGCARLFPDFAAQTGASYQAWRAENAAAIARLEPQLARMANPQAEALQAAEAEKWSPAERAAKRQSCEDFATATFQPLTANVARTPSEAWQRFIAASRAGDIEKAAECFLFTSRARYRQGFQQMGPDGLRETAASMGELRMQPESGGLLAHGDLVRRMADGHSQSFGVVFARDPRTGGWYIKMM
jgi:hypothetical protein